MIYKIKICPLCKSRDFKFFSGLKKNLYSEILSKILKIDERELLEKIKNKICLNCGLVFKNYWFSDKILHQIYHNYLPVHPRGKDFKSSLYSKSGFKKKYIELLNAKKNNNNQKFNEYIRTIKSIIFSIPNFEKLKSTKWITNKSSRSFDETLDLELLHKNFNKILKIIDKPQEFKRFSGYASQSLWDFLSSKIKIHSYGEIGCPRWVFLS